MKPDNSAWSVDEAAEYLGIARITLYKYVEARTVPFIKIGRRLLFDPEQLAAYRRERSVQPLRSRRDG